MRMTLEQLKAMDVDMLEAHWLDWQFPFDQAKCGRCVTGHHEDYKNGCHVAGHNKMRVQVTRLSTPGETAWERFKSNHFPNYGQSIAKEWLKANLEEFYALRLFYDSLFLQPAPELFEAVAIEEAHVEVGENNLITAPPSGEETK